MSESSAAWAAARGDKWSAQLAGMEATLAPIDEPLLRVLQLCAPVRIAEIGCGGGGTTLRILRHAPAGSVVHGFDISPTLVELARERTRANHEPIAFQVADMARAAPSQPYDWLVSRFGVMFFDDPAAAFANLGRWLAPGGRLLFAVWGPPADNPWMASARDVVGGIVPVPKPEPDAPGPFRYAEPERLLEVLDRAGFRELAVSEWRGALAIGGALSPADAAEFALQAFSSYAELLAAAGADARERAHQALTSVFSGHQREGAVRMQACVRFVTGRR